MLWHLKAQSAKNFSAIKRTCCIPQLTQKPSVRDPSEDDIIVNKRSRVDPANNNDIQFEYAEPEADPSKQFTTVQDIIRLDENQLTCVKGILTLRPHSVQQIPMKDGSLVSVRTLHCFWRYRNLSPNLVGNSHPRSRKSQILFHHRCEYKDLQLHQVSQIYSSNNLYHCWRILWTPKWRRFLQTFRCRMKLRSKNPTGW